MTAYTPDPHDGDFPVGLAFALALVTAVLLAVCGCCPTREALVEPPAPPPSVVLPTQTEHVYVSGPTVVLPDTVREASEPTAPVIVTEYLTPRPDTSTAFLLYGWRLTADDLTLYGRTREFRFRAVEDGETQVGEAVGRDSVAARVAGEPAAPPPVRIECPECPGPSLGDRLKPWLFLLAGAAGGVVIRSFIPR